MKINLFLLVILEMLFALPAKSQLPGTDTPMRFTLEEARQFAAKNSPVLLNSARDVEIAKKKIWETTAMGLPQANLSSAYNYSPKLAGLTQVFTGGADSANGGQNPFGFDINPEDLKTSFFMDVRVTQLIFSGEYIVGLQASKAYSNLAALTNSKSVADLMESVSNVYFEILVSRTAKKTLDSTLAVVEKTYGETQQLFKSGFVQSTDVDQLKVQSLNIRSNLAFLIRRIEFSERLLKFQMGVPIEQPVELTDNIDGLVLQMQLETEVIDSLSVEENIDYKLASAAEKLSMLNMRVKKAQFLPTLAGYYNRHEDFDNNFFNDQSPDMIGLSLNFPLFSSGQRLSQVGQAKLEYQKAQTNTQMLTEQLVIQYETMLAGYLMARDVFEMQKENHDLTYRIYMNSITKYREGVGSSLDMNQAQQQYIAAESNYYNALMTLVTARTNLENLLAKSN